MLKEARKPKGAAVGDGAEAPAAEGEESAAPAVAGKAQQRAKKADEYHARHADWVAQFNELTNGECAGGPGGVQWAAVRAWQQKHWQANNLLADGLIGPKTLEAARIVAKKSEKKDASGGDETSEGKGEGGKAEAAEASADKPKLDDEGAGTAPVEGPEADSAADDAKLPAPAASAAKQAPKATGNDDLARFKHAMSKLQNLIAKFKMPGPANQAKPERPDEKQAGQAASANAGGMLGAEALAGYEEAAAKVTRDGWRKPWKDRCDLLLEALNQSLAAEKVYPIERWNPTNKPGMAGQFHPQKWTIDLNQFVFDRPSASLEDQQKAVKAVFHEGRHAEQRFKMARSMARDKSPTEISSALGMKLEAVEAAIAIGPLDPNSKEGNEAKVLVADAVTHKREHKAVEEQSLEVVNAYTSAKELFDGLSEPDRAQVNGDWQRCVERVKQIYAAYENMPTEHDANAAEDKLTMPGE